MYPGLAGPEHTLHLHTEARGAKDAKILVLTPPKLTWAYFYPGNAGGAAHDHTP